MHHETHAENAYLFRHATVRDAAYQLLPPSRRAQLHHLALDILEETTLGMSLNNVIDLAEHAHLAQKGVTIAGDLPFRELRYLHLAAMNAAGKYENLLAAQLWQRVADHPAATTEERTEALAEAGLVHWMLGRREPALECYSRGIETADKDRQRAYLLIERGCLYRDVREDGPATRDLEKALELARRAGDKPLQLRALGNLCTIRDLGMTQAGVLDLYAPVLKLAREIGDLRAVGISHGQIGIACMTSENWAEAEKHLNEAINQLRQADDKLNECAMTSSLGTLYSKRTDGDRRENLTRAARHHREALEMKEASGFLFQKAAPLIGLAEAHREMGAPGEAERWANEALRVASEVGDPESIGRSHLQLGLAQLAKGDAATAERTLTYGFIAVEESAGAATKVALLSALARLLAGQGAWNEARVYARNAADLSADVADTRVRTRTGQLARAIEDKRLEPETSPVGES